MKTNKFTSTVADAQLEVWEWKHKLYEEIKYLDKYEQLKYIINKADKTKQELIERKQKQLNSA